MTSPPRNRNRPDSISGFLNSALDAAYLKTAGPMLVQINRLSNAQGSPIQKSLKKLDDEAARLAEDGERMQADNAQLEQTSNAYLALLLTTQNLILANDNAIQAAGQALAAPTLTAKVFIAASQTIINEGGNPLTAASFNKIKRAVAERGVNWVAPTTLDFATDYVSSQSWISGMNAWGTGYADLTKDTILKGISEGWGPRRVASIMRQRAEGIPRSAAENLTRTLQVTSARDAAVEMERINGAFLLGKIRIAKLDGNTCLACIGLHGTEMEIGERVDDHYRGKCSEWYRTLGGPEFPAMMQADSSPGNRVFVDFQTGPEWFGGLSPERQAAQRSFIQTPAKLKAFKAGTPLTEFIGESRDDTFGDQFVEKSLIDAIGKDDAAGFYVRNQSKEDDGE
jgi:hypothetical protein